MRCQNGISQRPSPRKKPSKEPRAKALPTERAEQGTLVAWLRFKKLLFTAVPNQRIFTGYGQLAALKKEGMQKGFPDILIFTVPPMRQFHGVAIEMKRQKGAKLSAEQSMWLNALSSVGWYCFMAQGADDAIKTLCGLGY